MDKSYRWEIRWIFDCHHLTTTTRKISIIKSAQQQCCCVATLLLYAIQLFPNTTYLPYLCSICGDFEGEKDETCEALRGTTNHYECFLSYITYGIVEKRSRDIKADERQQTKYTTNYFHSFSFFDFKHFIIQIFKFLFIHNLLDEIHA